MIVEPETQSGILEILMRSEVGQRNFTSTNILRDASTIKNRLNLELGG